MYTPTITDLTALSPEIILTLAAGLLLLIEAFVPPLRRAAPELSLIHI